VEDKIIKVANAHVEYQVHQSLESGDCVGQSKRRRSVAKYSPSGDESSLIGRIRVQLHLMIGTAKITGAVPARSSNGFQSHVLAQHGVGIAHGAVIKLSVVDATTRGALFLSSQHNI